MMKVVHIRSQNYVLGVEALSIEYRKYHVKNVHLKYSSEQFN
jgi:hypothetical protein